MIIRGCAGFSCIVSRLKPPSAEIKRPTGAYPGHFLHIEGVVHKAKTTKHPRFDGVAGRHDPHFGILLSSPVSDFPTAEFVRHTCDKTKIDPSAVLTIWLCNGVDPFTRLVGTDPLYECSRGEHTRRLPHGPFAMDPRGLDRVEPGAVRGQPTDNHATATRVFGVPVMGCEPRLHGLAHVPGSLVPDAP
jgi:hypothetical protein